MTLPTYQVIRETPAAKPEVKAEAATATKKASYPLIRSGSGIKPISKAAEKNLFKIAKAMKDGYVKHDNGSPAFMAASVENVSSLYRGYRSLSIAHYYEQNGDLMRDPEMVFSRFDYYSARTGKTEKRWFPVMYQQDGIGIYRELLTLRDDGKFEYHSYWQPDSARFAATWLENIVQQQEL